MPPTETELLQRAENAATLTHAERLLAEQQDEVKAMNQMMQYSQCVTIRDAQLAERKHMMLEEEAAGRRLDRLMEVERLKALENYEERERQRQHERLIGAAVRAPLTGL
jgi:Trichohyalin-plectin-homology domain